MMFIERTILKPLPDRTFRTASLLIAPGLPFFGLPPEAFFQLDNVRGLMPNFFAAWDAPPRPCCAMKSKISAFSASE